ncbi:DUF4192 domain-containing protein [Corynebacterium sp. A21]|uniref:DUF4192 domain-containing protein n=1 Tax=Corynebacterium sp. A21 TaxID=3457318 RepID=UPI003FD2D08D
MSAPTAIVSDPSKLIAELPGILGFYPENSLVVAAFTQAEDAQTRYSMGPVMRLDLGDLKAVSEVAEYLDGLSSDMVLAFVIAPETPDDINDQLSPLPNLVAAWQVPYAVTNEHFTMIFSDGALGKRTSIRWMAGTVAPVHAAASTRQLLTASDGIALTRSEVIQRLTYAPELLDHAFDMLVVIATDQHRSDLETAQAAGPDAYRTLIGTLVTQLRAALTAEDDTDEFILALASACMDADHPLLRDIALGALMEHPAAARELVLTVARTNRDTAVRANALAAYVATGVKLGTATDACMAMDVALAGAPGHTLASLVSDAVIHGVHEPLIEAVERGAAMATEQAGITL